MRLPASDRLTGEDLATLAQRAIRHARAANRSAATRDDFLSCLDDFSSESTPTQLEWLSLNAVRYASARSQLPDTILPPLSQVMLDNNRIAKERIENRLRELRPQLLE